MDISPLVSIIIPSYNRYILVQHVIKYLLNSTYKNIEIIVVNDCSTDERYYNGELEKYPKTTIIHLKENQRKVYNTTCAQGMVRNKGLEIAKGEYICLLDDDDFFLPDKISLQVKILKQNPSILMCSSEMFTIVHKEIKEDKLDYEITGRIHQDYNIKPILTFEDISKHNFICNSSCMIHRSLFEKVGFQNCCKYEDWEYWLRCLQHTNCIYINIPLVFYSTGNTKSYVY